MIVVLSGNARPDDRRRCAADQSNATDSRCADSEQRSCCDSVVGFESFGLPHVHSPRGYQAPRARVESRGSDFSRSFSFRLWRTIFQMKRSRPSPPHMDTAILLKYDSVSLSLLN